MRLVLSLLLAAALAAAAPADDVTKAEKDWIAGVTKNDFSLLGKVLAEDLFYLHSTGTFDTKATYIESMRSGKQKYVSIHVNDLKVRVYGEAAVINGDANFEFVTDGKPGKAHLKYTHVFARKGGAWQLVSHQSLRLPN